MTNRPIFFEQNRVFRVYTGGRLFADFFGDNSTDGSYPEEWIASSVKALNKNSSGEKEGISKIKGEDVYFDELIEQKRYEMLGPTGKMRILVKILDSAVRLPAQAHPDKAFSRKYFNSDYGKTESWIILGTRPDAKIFFGFEDGVDEEKLRAAIAASEHDKDSMERLMLCHDPSVRDVFLVPAKTVHAIGAGCLILEVQEPTDFTIQPEHWCENYKLSDDEMYLGLTEDEAIGCFDFENSVSPRITPRVETAGEGVTFERLIDGTNTPCFVINRITCEGGEFCLDVKDSYAVYIVTSGKGSIVGEGYEQNIGRGDYFFMPYSLMGKFSVRGNLEFVECY